MPGNHDDDDEYHDGECNYEDQRQDGQKKLKVFFQHHPNHLYNHENRDDDYDLSQR